MKKLLKREQFKSVLASGVLLLGLLLNMGCDYDKKDDFAALRANPTVERAGPYIVIGSIASAAEYLQTGFEDVAKIYRTPSKKLKAGSDTLTLSQGQHLLYPQGSEPSLFGELIFENISQDNVVLFIESMSQALESQGFSYVKLEAGSKFKYQHNVPPALVKVGAAAKSAGAVTAAKVVAVIGSVIIVGEELKSVYNGRFKCNLSTKAIQPDECVGLCKQGTCQGVPGKTQQYGPRFLGMAEPTACSCQ
jgi:hypothetical protein